MIVVEKNLARERRKTFVLYVVVMAVKSNLVILKAATACNRKL